MKRGEPPRVSHTLQLASVRCKLEPNGLQHVSVRRSLFQLVERDFNPKVAGSIPARPIEVPASGSFQ
jgi:hypothetical protein